jgi:hypothetical protein
LLAGEKNLGGRSCTKANEEQEGASEYIGDRLEQYGLEQAIEASQADENAHDQPTSVEIT